MKKMMILAMFICMVCTGVVYARWSDENQIAVTVSTGEISYKIAEDSLSVSYLDGDEQWQNIEGVVVTDDGESGCVVAMGTCDWLTEAEDIKICYRIVPTGANTIQKIAQEEQKSEFLMEVQKIQLTVDGKEHQIENTALVAPQLDWEGTIDVVELESDIWVTHQYRLKSESKVAYEEAYSRIARQIAAGSIGELQADYTFTIPVTIAQGGE